jgi:hypothetical protein
VPMWLTRPGEATGHTRMGRLAACALAPDRIADKTRQKVCLFPSMLNARTRLPINRVSSWRGSALGAQHTRRHSFPSTLKGAAPQWRRLRVIRCLRDEGGYRAASTVGSPVSNGEWIPQHFHGSGNECASVDSGGLPEPRSPAVVEGIRRPKASSHHAGDSRQQGH